MTVQIVRSGSATRSEAFGSLEWARRTRGRVATAELVSQAIAGLRMLMFERPKLWLYSHRLLGGGAQKLFDEVPQPRSDAANYALAELERCAPPFLAGHCHRTYVLGWMLGRVRGLACDAELLYVAALLHDLPLTSAYAFATEGSECFGLDGATIAGSFLRARGWDSARIHAAQDAICLHINVEVPQSRGIEAHLLNAGAGCDLTGVALPSLHTEDLQRLVQQHPRNGFAQGFAAVIEEQARRRPASRARLLQSFGLRKIISRAPFPH